jgi:hypothetical protein
MADPGWSLQIHSEEVKENLDVVTGSRHRQESTTAAEGLPMRTLRLKVGAKGTKRYDSPRGTCSDRSMSQPPRLGVQTPEEG